MNDFTKPELESIKNYILAYYDFRDNVQSELLDKIERMLENTSNPSNPRLVSVTGNKLE